MKKETFQKLVLILLPVLAVILATTADSVTVFDPATGITVVGAYFAVIPEMGSMWILPSVAAWLAVVAVILSIVYILKKYQGVLTGILWVALGAASAAVLPIVMESGKVIIPNIMLPVLMCGQALLAYTMGKTTVTNKPNSGHRLEKR